MVWARLGDCRNFVAPFAFSAAILLRRPGGAGPIETINDLNAYVANFWRAVAHDPDAVAAHADWPVNETDLHTRHQWLVNSDAACAAMVRVRSDPDFYDAKIAGWWCWGACCWIGSGWCEDRGAKSEQIPRLSTNGPDWNGLLMIAPKRPILAGEHANGKGLNCFSTAQKRPQFTAYDSEFGRGVHGRPQLADAYSRGRGVNANDTAGACADRRAWITDWMRRLADRLRPVRVCCGHWARICDSESTLTRLGVTGAFLDPPYRKSIDGKENRAAQIYANDGTQDVNALCDEVQEWSLKWGGEPLMRIAVCGLEGEYPKLDAAGWKKVEWKSRGGYGNRSAKGKENRERERIWFSPNCLDEKPRQQKLFEDAA